MQNEFLVCDRLIMDIYTEIILANKKTLDGFYFDKERLVIIVPQTKIL